MRSTSFLCCKKVNKLQSPPYPICFPEILCVLDIFSQLSPLLIHLHSPSLPWETDLCEVPQGALVPSGFCVKWERRRVRSRWVFCFLFFDSVPRRSPWTVSQISLILSRGLCYRIPSLNLRLLVMALSHLFLYRWGC